MPLSKNFKRRNPVWCATRMAFPSRDFPVIICILNSPHISERKPRCFRVFAMNPMFSCIQYTFILANHTHSEYWTHAEINEGTLWAAKTDEGWQNGGQTGELARVHTCTYARC